MLGVRVVGVLLVVALLGVGCVSGSGGGLVVDGESALEASPDGGAEGGELLVGELVASGFLTDGTDGTDGSDGGDAGGDAGSVVGEGGSSESGGSGGSLVLVSVGVSSLTVGWGEGFAAGAAGFRLRWRVRPFEELEGAEPEDGGGPWSVVDLPASARSYRVAGLTAGGRYVVRVAVLDSSGREVSSARGGFETLALPPVGLTASASAYDTVVLRWSSPADWSPVGYVLEWRVRGEDFAFSDRLRLPPGRTSQPVAGLSGGTRYVFRLTALTAGGWQSLPARAALRTPSAPSGGLSLRVSAPSVCSTGEGRSRTFVDHDRLSALAAELYPPGAPEPTGEEWDALWSSPRVLRTVREGVGSFTLSWEAAGGAPPYKLSVSGVEASGASGSVEVTCAREGVDLNDLADPDASVVVSGPKTVTVTVTDSAGASAVAAAVVEVVKEVAYNEPGTVIDSGSTHRSGFQYAQVPEGMRIVFEGVVNVSWDIGIEDPPPSTVFEYRQVTDGPRATAVWTNTLTGEEVKRFVIMHTITPDGDTIWSTRRSAELTPEENAFWDQYFNSLSVFPEGDAAVWGKINEVIEGFDEIAKTDPEVAKKLAEFRKRWVFRDGEWWPREEEQESLPFPSNSGGVSGAQVRITTTVPCPELDDLIAKVDKVIQVSEEIIDQFGDEKTQVAIELVNEAREALRDAMDQRVGLLSASSWRPYGGLAGGGQGLPCDSLVSVHPRLLSGESIRVCVKKPSGDDKLRVELLDALGVAVGVRMLEGVGLVRLLLGI